MQFKKDVHPLSMNFKKLKRYDLNMASLDEIVFFEWLILKQKSFGEDKAFYYQNHRVMDDLAIKRTRLETIKSKFVDYGLIIESKGILNTTHYFVNEDFISNFVSDYVLEVYRGEYIAQVSTLNFRGTENMSEDEQELTMEMIDKLDRLYNERKSIYNELNDKALTLNLQLDYSNKTIYQLNQLRLKHNVETIFSSFSVFIDALLDERDHTTHILNNFSSYDSHLNRFPVFGHYNSLYSDNDTYF